MEQEKLIALIEKLRNFPREQSTLEFKSNLKEPKEIGQYISALGNSAALERHDRAWMVWGIDDSTHAVTGTQFNPSKAKGEGKPVAHHVADTKNTPSARFHVSRGTPP